MDFQEGGEEFSSEDVETVIKNTIAIVLESAMYNPKKVNDWCNSIIDSCLKELQSLSRPYKYVITAVIMQRNGGGLVTSAATFWDGQKDGVCKVSWDNETMHAVVTVYGLSVNIDNQSEMD
ncbi:hypothetical protein TL16_g09983 [Triparma laevis f. inornata]|uniref:Uncharacterized protein n=2 Tax=Triparma laevis TaxID=1534972 RepID=A0A9W7L0Q2_9STRA|nr:hypothetical protein TL16_g09983 [Triparma laevis f. inornata]GMI18155.1 hypothetical protein TrLO_g4623 [Triparma laevis f. longispina]